MISLNFREYDMLQWTLLIAILAVVSIVIYQIHWHMNYKWEYSKSIETQGVVTDMRYVASYTTMSTVGKTTTSTHHPQENHVYIKTIDLGNIHRNSSHLYQRVRIDDELKITYIKRYRVSKDNSQDKKFDRNILKTITTPKGRVIEL